MHATKSCCKKQRSLSIVAREGDTLLLEIIDGRKPEPTYYFATPIPSDWGAAFKVEKQDEQGTAEVYDVLIDPVASLCSCKGFSYYCRDCRHISALKALAARGIVPGVARKFGLAEVDGPFKPGRSDEPRPAPRSSLYRSAGDFAANDPTGWDEHCLDLEGPDDAA